MGIAYLRKSVWILKKFQATIFVLKKINIKKKVGFVFKIQTLFTKVLILLLLLELVVINVLSLLRLCTVDCFNKDITVNRMDFNEYFQNNPIIINEIQKLQNYFPATWIETNNQTSKDLELTPLGQQKGFFTAHVSVKGGGLTSQAKAVRLAIARAASQIGD